MPAVPSARRVVAAVLPAAMMSALLVPVALVAGAAPASADITPTGQATTATTAGPAPASASGSSSTTAPLSPLTLPTATTRPPAATTTTAPAAPAGTVPRSPTPTNAKPAGGVPPVPTGGPPTTAAPPGAPAPPPPDPAPVLAEVADDLAQLQAIADYQPAQALVAAAQGRVTSAGAAVQSARHALEAAQQGRTQATSAQDSADARLRQMAVAAYIGVGYSTPGMGAPVNGNGDQGPGTVSTPGGLTGIEELDAKEMLLLVGQRARQSDNQAHESVNDASKQVTAAQTAYQKAEAAVATAESQLLSAQQTFKLITTAALTPGAAGVADIPDLASISQPPGPGGGAGPAGTGAAGAAGGTAGPADPATHTDVATQSSTASPDPATTTPAGTSPGTAGESPGTATTLAQPVIQQAPDGRPVAPDILSASVLTGPELAAWFSSTGRQANTTVPVDQLAMDYQAWGQKTGVRYDVAFAQSVVETGFFSFPAGGQLTSKDNNFAGIGACDSCAHGWSFPDASTGVGAQLELLYEYATSKAFPAGVPDVIGAKGAGGCCSNWMALAGVWASSVVYGISIMTIYNQMLSWVIPQRMAEAGLIGTSTTPPAAQGPRLAPLPGSPPTTAPGSSSTTAAPGRATTTTSKPPVAAASARSGD